MSTHLDNQPGRLDLCSPAVEIKSAPRPERCRDQKRPAWARPAAWAKALLAASLLALVGCQVAVAPGHGWGVGLLTDVTIDVVKVDAKGRTVETVHYGRTVDGPALGTAAMMFLRALPLLAGL